MFDAHPKLREIVRKLSETNPSVSELVDEAFKYGINVGRGLKAYDERSRVNSDPFDGGLGAGTSVPTKMTTNIGDHH